MALNLNADWKIKALSKGKKAESLVGPGVNDSSWQKINLGIWKYPTEVKSKDLILRRNFTVPNWSSKDEIYLAITAWYTQQTLVNNGSMKVWLDGKRIGGDLRPNTGIPGLKLDLKPGSSHQLALEITASQGNFTGIKGSCFLFRIQQPEKVIDLAGKWFATEDVLDAGKAVTLPGTVRKALAFKREIDLPASLSGKEVYLKEIGSTSLIGCIINGSYVRRHHHLVGEITYLNITPWVKPGGKNEIELVRWGRAGRTTVKKVQLYIYNK